MLSVCRRRSWRWIRSWRSVGGAVLLVFAGCSPYQTSQRSFLDDLRQLPFPRITPGNTNLPQHYQAAQVRWNELVEAQPNVASSADFAQGFQEGYVKQAGSGGRSLAPPMPPRKYWGLAYQNPASKDLANQWSKGFLRGAHAAREDRLAASAQEPVEATTDANVATVAGVADDAAQGEFLAAIDRHESQLAAQPAPKVHAPRDIFRMPVQGTAPSITGVAAVADVAKTSESSAVAAANRQAPSPASALPAKPQTIANSVTQNLAASAPRAPRRAQGDLMSIGGAIDSAHNELLGTSNSAHDDYSPGANSGSSQATVSVESPPAPVAMASATAIAAAERAEKLARESAHVALTSASETISNPPLSAPANAAPTEDLSPPPPPWQSNSAGTITAPSTTHTTPIGTDFDPFAGTALQTLSSSTSGETIPLSEITAEAVTAPPAAAVPKKPKVKRTKRAATTAQPAATWKARVDDSNATASTSSASAPETAAATATEPTESSADDANPASATAESPLDGWQPKRETPSETWTGGSK